MNFRDDVVQRIRAGAPGLWVETHEETRVLPELLAAAQILSKDKGRRVTVPAWKWTEVSGVVDIASGEVICNADTKFPHAMNVVASEFSQKRGGAGILALCDAHEVLKASLPKRMLREIMDEGTAGTLVVISPTNIIPLELERYLMPVPFNLPSAEELVTIPESLGWSIQHTSAQMLADSSVGLTWNEARVAMRLAAARRGMKNWQEMALEIWDEKSKIFENKGLMVVQNPTETWNDVGGMYRFKQWVDDRFKVFSHEARMAKVPMPRGVLFVGPYGTGKSLLSRVIANKLGWRYLEIDLGKVLDPYVGVTERKMRELLHLIELHIPCVVRIDEIAHQVSGHESSGFTDSGVVSRMIQSLLTWMEERRDGVFIVASTNEPWRLPPHMVRPGRFDALFHTPLPDADALGDILDIKLRRYIEPDYEIKGREELVDLMREKQFAGAEVEQTVVESLQKAWPGRPAGSDLIGTAREIVSIATTMREQVFELEKWAKNRTRNA